MTPSALVRSLIVPLLTGLSACGEAQDQASILAICRRRSRARAWAHSVLWLRHLSYRSRASEGRRGQVGPRLEDYAQQHLLAGFLPNTPQQPDRLADGSRGAQAADGHAVPGRYRGGGAAHRSLSLYARRRRGPGLSARSSAPAARRQRSRCRPAATRLAAIRDGAAHAPHRTQSTFDSTVEAAKAPPTPLPHRSDASALRRHRRRSTGRPLRASGRVRARMASPWAAKSRACACRDTGAPTRSR